MGNTEQEQAEAMKRYIREIVIPEYAKNFNKGLLSEDIKFYGKIHFSRDRSNNELNMHCHLIVSRKDQSNKKKLSPLTNHRNTKKGVIKGGFDRTHLFQQAEQGFDRLFNYNRPLIESFEYYNTIKNGSISEQISLQEKMLTSEKENRQIGISADKQNSITENIHEQNNIQNQSSGSPDLVLSSALGILSPNTNNLNEEQPVVPPKIKKKRNKGLRR